MGFIYISDGIDDALAVHLNQYADAWSGVAGKGVPLNMVAVNDPINFAISGRNLDPTNSRTLQLLKADGTVLLQVDASGVKVSPDGTVASVPATLTGTQTFTGKTISLLAASGNTLIVPAARAFHSANQSLTSGIDTVLAFNSERFDTDTIHDTVTNNSRLTCKTAGIYAISVTTSFDVNGTGYRVLYIRLNGVNAVGFDSRPPNAAVGTTVTVTTIYQLAVNDYVEALANQNSGGALNIITTNNYSPEFSMVKIA